MVVVPETNFLINFGPQHPSAHGVLRLVVELVGEVVYAVDPHIGLLHRGTEKLLEYKTFQQGLPYFDRLDYVSMMAQEHVFALVIEMFGNLVIPRRASFIRVIFLELTRILNHLMSLTTHALDVGALTPFLWAFEEREKIMEFYERVSGARMHAFYIRPGGIAKDIPLGFLDDVFKFCLGFVDRINELEEALCLNRIWKQRLVNVGILSQEVAINYGCSGVLLRSTGIKWDLRKAQAYESYSKLKFEIPVGRYGDSYDRFILRIEEMRQSVKIINQCLSLIPVGDIKSTDVKFVTPLRKGFKISMQDLIDHFKLHMRGFNLGYRNAYIAAETPKGEFGVFLVSNSGPNPYRCKIRAPGYFHLQNLEILSRKILLSDLVTLIGSIDIVFGEIDR